MAAFAGIFPNANVIISANLLTRRPSLDGDAMRQRDRETLATIRQWLGEERFNALRPQLRAIETRLAGFVD